MYYYKYKTRIGEIFISSDESFLLEVSYSKNNDYIEKETVLIKKALIQINEYLEGSRKVFDLPLNIVGTDFQKAVYTSLLEIPYGEVKSYKQIAETINRNKAVRAVGSACNKNRFSIIIPCHRVIASSNKLQGYAGGLKVKKDLLELEGLTIVDEVVLKD